VGKNINIFKNLIIFAPLQRLHFILELKKNPFCACGGHIVCLCILYFLYSFICLHLAQKVLEVSISLAVVSGVEQLSYINV
jgi:multidrug transporter EmrE-like cation transporter